MGLDSQECEIKIDELCINAIRVLSIDAVQRANSGHPGAPMGLASAGYVLWTRILKHNPKNPDWQDRDRFVLSCGHASMLLYSLLYLSGYNLTLEDIKNFRQFKSRTPGHPEYRVTFGVEVSTGPLGQGIANAVGMAMAERHMAAKFNRPGYNLVDHFTYVVCGDGDLMEGVSSEAVSLAGHLALSKLICIYDSNNITIEGSTDITFTEDLSARFLSYNWHVIKVNDGNDLDQIENALKIAKSETDRPSIIILKTHIAYGSPNLQDNSASHGAPLGENEVLLTKKALGWSYSKPFFVPDSVIDHFKKCCVYGADSELEWLNNYKLYAKKFPELSNQWIDGITRFMFVDWDFLIFEFKKYNVDMSTRIASGKVLNAIASDVPSLVGGSSDLSSSNKTYMNDFGEFQKNSYIGRNIRFGVREFAMGGIMSGMFLHGGIRPYGGTFLVFCDYMRPAIRLASMMKLPIIYIFTHDSIAVGEDGPTHQPVEHLASLRAIPGLRVVRPADAIETIEAWREAMMANDYPVALILSRQTLPLINSKNMIGGVSNGAYIISDCSGTPDIIIIATGSEVHISVGAKKILDKKGVQVRIINMPSWEFFEEKSESYKNYIFPKNVENRIVVEAGISMGWERYMGKNGVFIGVETFGFSAPGQTVMKNFGLTINKIVNKALELYNKK